MDRRENRDPRPDAGALSYINTTSALHVTVLTDPRAVIDSQSAARISFEHRTVANVDAMPEEDMGGVEHQNSLLDHRPLPEEA